MLQKETTCTISGMRPHKLPVDLDLFELLRRMKTELRKSIHEGFSVFQTGMAMGVDIWAAEVLLALKAEFPDIALVCYLPCETQADRWPTAWREKYFNTFAKADNIICLQPHYTAGCMQRRNRLMIDRSSRLIAVHDGKTPGGTAQTVCYAQEKRLCVIRIDPQEHLQILPNSGSGRT